MAITDVDVVCKASKCPFNKWDEEKSLPICTNVIYESESWSYCSVNTESESWSYCSVNAVKQE